MAEPESNAPCAPTSGVIHVRTRLTSHFTVISNRLAQRGGSAIALGVATYILSLPDGAPVSIAALCAHFSEGEILIARALRELEAAGYLERRRERIAGGRICTRTYAHDVPGGKPRPQGRRVGRTPPASVPDPEAAAVLTSLRRRDSRLLLSEREVAELAPAVREWLTRGVAPEAIAKTLATDLPVPIQRRPARLLAYRLANQLPPPAGRPHTTTAIPAPLQNCPGCERAFRSPTAGRCRDCRTRNLPATG
ncbi:hypothetical protein ACIGXM_16560 [Kitasatospora sp. NPDC052896]|uniref:hypothetical protein n=1 Tax=Kitasatospora sp. NPDC052896 TaxID=3364061 RepID=UPI0037C6F126